MVVYASTNGVRPTAKHFHTTVKTVRKWIRRFEEGGYQALDDLSHRPHHSPNKTPSETEARIIKLKREYKRLGAIQIKVLENVEESTKTMCKIWRENNVSTGKRRKKHVTKQNLREVKKLFGLFERVCEDTKDLCDIPEYWPQMTSKNLPKVQYTFREISCGVQFIGFANERSLTHATLFANYVNEHLGKRSMIIERGVRQTDNGVEYCGSWSAKKSSAYTLAIESMGLIHSTIPPGAHRFQSDVETVHNLIEVEFYELETFTDRADFMCKALTYQTFFNFKRPNTYKENKSPWQLAKEKIPNISEEVLMLPPVDLDALLENKLQNKLDYKSQGGYDLSSNPFKRQIDNNRFAKSFLLSNGSFFTNLFLPRIVGAVLVPDMESTGFAAM